jgi:activator of HSP90 ATPase
MRASNGLVRPVLAPTRRSVLSGIAVALGGLTSATVLRGAIRQQTPAMAQVPASEANNTRTALHQEIDLPGTPARFEQAVLDAKQFAAFSGMPATIDPREGGAFSMFGGMIVGRNVELVSGRRIVQAWRPTHWDPGVYSMVRFAYSAHGSGSRVILDHTGFPQGEYDHLSSGWDEHYWEPLKKFLA